MFQPAIAEGMEFKFGTKVISTVFITTLNESLSCEQNLGIEKKHPRKTESGTDRYTFEMNNKAIRIIEARIIGALLYAKILMYQDTLGITMLLQ